MTMVVVSNTRVAILVAAALAQAASESVVVVGGGGYPDLSLGMPPPPDFGSMVRMYDKPRKLARPQVHRAPQPRNALHAGRGGYRSR